MAAAWMLAVASSPDLGKAEARCRPGESGPSLLVSVEGLKDRVGLIKLEVYPDNDAEFLSTETKLLAEGKVFRRVEERVPQSGPVALCARVPGPGSYSVVILHDRNSNHKFAFTVDGVAFPGNPKLGWSKPSAAAARLVAGAHITRTTVVLNYWRGFGMGPVAHGD